MLGHSHSVSRRRFLGLGVIGGISTVVLAACSQSAPASQSSTPATQAQPTTVASTSATTPASSTSAAPTAASNAAPTAASNSAPATQSAPASTTNLGGQQATLWGLKYDPHVERYNMLAAAFKKNTGAVLNIQPQPDILNTGKFTAAIAAGTAPDIACIMGKVLLPIYLRKALVNVSDLFKAWNLDPSQVFAGDSITAYTYGHQVWGVPVEVNNVGDVVSIPTDDVAKIGATSPPTNGKDFMNSYDDMWSLAKQLQDKLGTTNGKVTRWGLSSRAWDAQSLFGIIRSQGTNWWDENTQKFNITSDAGVTALQLFAETPVNMGIETYLNQTHMDAALAGKVFLARGNMSLPGEAKKVGRHYELAMVPPVKGAQSDTNPLFIGEGGWGFVIPSKAKQMDVATAFLKFIATTEAQTIWAGIYGGIVSSWKELNNPENPRWASAKDDYVLRGIQMRAKYIDRTVYYGEGFGYIADVEKHVSAVTDGIREKKLTAQQGAQQLQQLLQQQYQQYQADLKTLSG